MEELVIVATALVVFVGGCVCAGVYTNKVDNEAIVAMVQKGVDPLIAMCAIRPTEKMASVCTLAATKK